MMNTRHYADDDYVPVEVAAEIGYFSTSYMNKMRITGEGPAFIKIGKSIRYRVGDVRAWLESKRVTSTAEYPRKGAA